MKLIIDFLDIVDKTKFFGKDTLLKIMIILFNLIKFEEIASFLIFNKNLFECLCIFLNAQKPFIYRTYQIISIKVVEIVNAVISYHNKEYLKRILSSSIFPTLLEICIIINENNELRLKLLNSLENLYDNSTEEDYAEIFKLNNIPSFYGNCLNLAMHEKIFVPTLKHIKRYLEVSKGSIYAPRNSKEIVELKREFINIFNYFKRHNANDNIKELLLGIKKLIKEEKK